MTKQLEETFNIDGGDSDENVVAVFDLEIPADAKLSDISKLALEAYKMQMENIQHIEPQYRARSLEVAKQYLELAKAAIADDLKYQQAQEKLDRDNGSKGGEGEGESEGNEESSGLSRHELLLALSRKGRKENGQEEPEQSSTGTG